MMRMRAGFGLLTLLAVLGMVPEARAQATTSVRPQGPMPRSETRSPGRALRQMRLEHLDYRRREGFTLLGAGIASTVGGGVAMAARHDDEAWLAAGITTASFGIVNALLSFGLLDLSGEARRQAREGVLGGHEDFEAVREQAEENWLRSGQFLAMNLGLDVFYIGAGLLAYGLGRVQDPDTQWLKGMGLSSALQGAFLFAFDLQGWIGANARAAELEALGDGR